MIPIETERIAFSDVLLAPLLAEREAEGGAFLLRLRDEWRSGATRFGRPNEARFGAFADGRLVGMRGLLGEAVSARGSKSPRR